MLNVILNTRNSKANASTSEKNVTPPGFNCSDTVTVKCSCCNMKTEIIYLFLFLKGKKIKSERRQMYWLSEEALFSLMSLPAWVTES